MRASTLLLLGFVALACVSVVNCEEEDLAAEGAPPPTTEPKVDEKDVLVLTTANFNETIAANKYILVEFYAPWCGHCKTLKGPYAEAATLAKALNPPVAFAKVDATQEEALGSRFDVQGFPTLKYFTDGESIDYTGGREAADLVAWVKKRSGEPTEVFTTESDLLAFVESHPSAILGFFPSPPTGELFAAFQQAALKSNKPFALGPVDMGGRWGVERTPAVVLVKKFDEGKVVYDGAVDADALVAWVSTNARPSVMEFKEELVEEMFGNELPKVCLFAANDEVRAQFDVAAKSEQVRGKVVMIVVPKSADPNFYEFVGVDVAQEKPLVVQIEATSGKRYRLDENTPITAESIAAFVSEVAAGSIKPHLKSAPPPKENNGPVIEVVSSTFKELVIDTDKNVVIEFYAPWCGHCQQLAPVYDKTAAHFKESNPDDVVIAKIDGTLNEVDIGVNIEGFPTILAFAKGAKDTPIDISNKPRKNAKQFINSIQKVFKLSSSRPGEDLYRDAVDRLKVVLKQKPALLAFVADELQKVAKAAEERVHGKDEL